MPLWTSYSLTGAPEGSHTQGWTSDVRLDATDSVTCDDYDVLQENTTMATLYYPGKCYKYIKYIDNALDYINSPRNSVYKNYTSTLH